MHTKMASRFHLPPVKMAVINNTNTNKYWRRCGGKGKLLHCWWECKLVQLLCKSVWSFLEKIKVDLPCNPVISVLGISRMNVLQNIIEPLAYPCLLQHCSAIAWLWKQSRWSTTDEWIKKVWYRDTMEFYSSIKRIYLYCLQVNRDGTEEHHVNKVSQAQKGQRSQVLCHMGKLDT
jgi:hypothetical protein